MESSNITNRTLDILPRYKPRDIIYASSFLVSAFAFIINVFMLAILSSRPRVRKQRYTVLVMSLGFGDTLTSLAGIIWLILLKLRSTSVPLCGIMTCLFVIGNFMSIHITFVICLNRYLSATGSSLMNKLYGGHRKFILMFVPGVCVALLMATSYYLWENEITQCSITYVMGRHMMFYSTVMVITCIPLLLAIIICYALTIRAIIHRFRVVNVDTVFTITHVHDSNSMMANRRKKKMIAVKTLGIILVLLVLGTCPFVFSFLLLLFGVDVDKIVRAYLSWPLLLNSALNPIIYAWRIGDLRKEITEVICCCFKK